MDNIKFEVLAVDEHDVQEGLQVGDILIQTSIMNNGYSLINERSKDEYYTQCDPVYIAALKKIQ